MPGMVGLGGGEGLAQHSRNLPNLVEVLPKRRAIRFLQVYRLRLSYKVTLFFVEVCVARCRRVYEKLLAGE